MIIQEWNDLNPQQRAIAETMTQDPRLRYMIDTQTGFALDLEEANILFDGSYIAMESPLSYYSRKALPKITFAYPISEEKV